MPKAPRAPAPTPVANLTNEDKISWLVHQHEGLQDWRVLVDERLAKGEQVSGQMQESVKRLEDGQKRLEESHRTLESGQKDTHIMLQKVLLAVQGQSDKGLEVPGMADRMKTLEDDCKALQGKVDGHEQFKFRVQLVLGAFSAAIGVGTYKIYPYIKQILAILQ